MILKGRTIVLRPITLDDAEITLRWRLSSRARFLQPGPKTADDQRRWIASRPADEFNFIIEYKQRPVGTIALHDIIPRHQTASTGRLLIGEQEFVGVAPVGFEADMLVCDYAFDQLDVHKIHGVVMEDNVAMIRTRLYLGYKQDGLLRDHYIYDGKHKAAVVLSILEDEYRKINGQIIFRN